MGTVSTTLPSDGQTIDASDVNTPINAILSEFNGNIDDNNIKTGANINGAKILAGSLPGTALDTTAASGWFDLGATPDGGITNNGNRSYDLVFNSTDLTDTVSEGMRLRTTRTVTAPTQCADLESGSSQYFSKTSPAGISFTTTFTCSAWVKLESYAAGGIICRRNGSTEGWSLGVSAAGLVQMSGFRIAANNKVINTYQSLPLNKWVHVAACIDMTVGDTTAQKIWFDGVEVPRQYTLTGTATAIVQGTTALVVGAENSAGSNPFDGKIAQASVHSACLSDAQVKALMAQTIDSSSPSIVSGFTLNGVLTDVSANANDLTASGGALATNVDSPFGNYLGGTLDYAIITKTAFSTNTTLTVQVPEGCTIPTSGGVSAVAYSTQKAPYGFVADSGRWSIDTLISANTYQAAVTSTTVYNPGNMVVNFPVGAFDYSSKVQANLTGNTDAAKNMRHGLSTSAASLSFGYEAQTNLSFYGIMDVIQLTLTCPEIPFSHTSATSYYYNFRGEGAGTLTNMGFNNTAISKITLTPTYL